MEWNDGQSSQLSLSKVSPQSAFPLSFMEPFNFFLEGLVWFSSAGTYFQLNQIVAPWQSLQQPGGDQNTDTIKVYIAWLNIHQVVKKLRNKDNVITLFHLPYHLSSSGFNGAGAYPSVGWTPCTGSFTGLHKFISSWKKSLFLNFSFLFVFNVATVYD